MTSHKLSYTLDLDYVEQNWPNPRYRNDISDSTTNPPTTASEVTIVHDPRQFHEPNPNVYQEQPSPSSQPTVVPYAPTPPPAPTPPSIPSQSEIYGPDRLFGHLSDTSQNAGRSLIPSPGVRFDEPQFPLMATPRDPAYTRDFKDELARAAGVVTPGVDDGPYIRYALDALTRPREDGRGLSEGYASSDYDETYQQPYHYTPTTVPSPLRPFSAHLPAETPTNVNVPRFWSMVQPPTPIASPPATIAEDGLQERRRRQQRHLEQMRDPSYNPREDPAFWAAFNAHPTESSARSNQLPALPSEPPTERVALPPSEPRPERRGSLKSKALPPKSRFPPLRFQDHWQARPDVVTDPAMPLHDIGKALRAAAPLTLKPWVLGSESLLLLASLCILMIAALVFCAIYSISHTGLTPYAGTIYGGQYFLFRMLPQLLAIIILIYAQCIITAAFWVLPFSALASDDRRERRDAVFLPLYPKSFLWPQLVGSWNIWIPILNVWLLNFTIPLQSSLFTVILVDGTWTWATVQGVAWTLVALYLSFFLSLLVMFVYWQHRRTGMRPNWAIRTLADIISMVSQSNSLSQYHGLETAPSRRVMRERLSGNPERLGLWFTPEAPELGTWYSLGVSAGEKGLVNEKIEAKEWASRHRGEEFLEAGEGPESPDVRYRYLPWCFRDIQIISFVAVASLLLIALIIVSFLNSTDLRNGFLPLLNAGPVAGAFSAADFLYSFVPSLLGLVLFLMFQSLDLTLRILAPWGELGRAEGSRAANSLLLDYAVCLPLESTYKAARNKHWRVAFVSLLSPLFALLPVLSGGIFLALTPPSGVVRMYPNVPAFGIVLALLFLYVAGLACLVPNRKQFRLPHAVTCLAEIISFCSNEQLCEDEVFDLYRVIWPIHLAGNLDIGKDWHRQGRWALSTGRSNGERFGIKRLSKYTVNPKKLRAYDRWARGELISAPLPHDSDELFGR
ncbi:hypothetical protein GGR54DRAFT_119653 [Hypoxylon sp. NC1633]|nr:hypothetical protein GGR54DRAFT_119653 [Hypoxylon sp. NC1633]